jgi:hypothetical protein
LKEVLISYVFALVSSGPLTEKELDKQAEDFIKDELEAVEAASAKDGKAIRYVAMVCKIVLMMMMC